MNEKLVGKLSVWVPQRNFGFISVTDQHNVVERFFLHKSRIIAGTPAVNAIVRFNINPVQEGEQRGAMDAEIVPNGGAK